MRTMLVGLAAMGVGGTAFWAGSPGPDFDRQLNKSPMEVYAAFSALGEEGEISQPGEDGAPRVTRRVVKVPGESIEVEFLLENRPVLDVELNFEPGAEGRGTRLTAEFDIDAYELGSAFETEAGIALSMVPNSYLDAQFASFMDDMADDIEAGRPLPPLGLGEFERPAQALDREQRGGAAKPDADGAASGLGADGAAAADGRPRRRGADPHSRGNRRQPLKRAMSGLATDAIVRILDRSPERSPGPGIKMGAGIATSPHLSQVRTAAPVRAWRHS